MNINLRPLIGIALFFIWLFFFLLSSCTTVRNAERRHDRIVKNFPQVHQSDTIEVEKIVTVEIQGFKDSNIFIFDTINTEPIYDTIYLQDSIIIVNTLWRSENGKNNLKTDIIVPNRKVTKTIKEKQPMLYVKQPLEWWQRKGWLFVLLAISFLVGYLLRKLDENLN